MFKRLKYRIRNIFIAGLLVILPIGITYFILSFLFNNIDSLLSPILTRLLIFIGLPLRPGYRIPGLGLMATILIIFIVGLLTTNIFGRKLVKFGELILEKIPVVRSVYTGAKQVINTIAHTDKKAFRQVVMVEFPRKGVYSIGFVTGETKGEVQDLTKEEVVNVFLPTTPNPTSGFLLFAPRNEITPLSMTVEDGLKLIISGGIVTPKWPI
ncbi:MAG: DUF502 domain-containing protein [Nitrospinae bacterium]|nr:DUF502 domain-containing protein [Nitrospinota bacterium]